MLVARELRGKARRIPAGLQVADREFACNRHELFHNLNRRLIRGNDVLPGVMKGRSGAGSVLAEAISPDKASVRMWKWIRLARIVPAGVTRNLLKIFCDRIRYIFSVSFRAEVSQFFDLFSAR